MHQAEEAGADLGVRAGGLVLQGLDEAEHGRERRAQLVAGIGDEIDPHPLGGIGFAAVGEVDEPVAPVERGDGHQPPPSASPIPTTSILPQASAAAEASRSTTAGWRSTSRTS